MRKERERSDNELSDRSGTQCPTDLRNESALIALAVYDPRVGKIGAVAPGVQSELNMHMRWIEA